MRCDVILWSSGSKWNNLSKDFKAVLEMRSTNMKKARERREMFAFGGSAPPLVPDDMSVKLCFFF